MHVVGIIGKLNAGKDTIAASYQKRGYVRKAFADPIKEIVHQLFKVPREILWGSSKARTGDVRKMLQGLGTDYARNIDPDVWVKQMRNQLQRCRVLKHHGVVIPDVRFLNEAKMLRKEEHATLIHVIRPHSDKHETKSATKHQSETESTLIPHSWVTHTIINDGSLADLENAVQDILGDHT